MAESMFVCVVEVGIVVCMHSDGNYIESQNVKERWQKGYV